MLFRSEEFPKEINAEAECDELTVVELWELVTRFFTLKPKRQTGNGWSDSTT